MEQHPVPQNVTTFQFRLIGDMTLKQFGYLCAGAILAFIAYKLPLPFLITWPLTFAFAFLGVGFAFIPVEERPMDVWVFSFFKSVYNPTQYIWTKTAPPPEPPAVKAAAKVPQPVSVAPPAPPTSPVAPTPASVQPQPTTSSSKTILSGLFQPAAQMPQQEIQQPVPTTTTRAATVVTLHQHKSFLDWLSELWTPKKHAAPTPQPAAVQHPAALSVTPVTGRRIQVSPPSPVAQPAKQSAEMIATQQHIAQLEQALQALQEQLATKSATSERILELQQQLTDVLKQKSTTEDELIAIKRNMTNSPAIQKEIPIKNPPPTEPVSSVKSKVTVINTQDAATKVGLPRLTNIANIITGIVKDDENNLLPGILVTVTNHEGIPMRALKTNKLGQFAASTPLGSGVYFVEIEDPRGRFTFSRVQITLNGTVVPALEIIAKSQKQLTREKLAQEIFGKPTI